jgi:hypothetical protein
MIEHATMLRLALLYLYIETDAGSYIDRQAKRGRREDANTA